MYKTLDQAFANTGKPFWCKGTPTKSYTPLMFLTFAQNAPLTDKVVI